MEKTKENNLKTEYPEIKEIKLKLVDLAKNDFARYTSRIYGRIDVKKYTFKYRTIDLADTIKLCRKENINVSKAIGIGLNYIRAMTKEQTTKLIEKTYNELKNRQTKRNKQTTIAMTKNNWEYLNTFEPKLKYSLLIAASRLAKIYNPKKDLYK